MRLQQICETLKKYGEFAGVFSENSDEGKEIRELEELFDVPTCRLQIIPQSWRNELFLAMSRLLEKIGKTPFTRELFLEHQKQARLEELKKEQENFEECCRHLPRIVLSKRWGGKVLSQSWEIPK
jgi:hypothetical protein